MMEYTLIRSKRKTIGIHITGDAAVEVRAPLKVPKAEIDRVVESKQKWIRSHLSVRERQLESKAAFTLDYGGAVPMLGGEYPITARDGNRAGFDGERFYMPPGLPSGEIKYAVIQIYRMVAKPLLTNKVIDYAERMAVTPAGVKINGAKTRWGSCNNLGGINFSWRLIMAEDDVIDYVVVHELAHMKEWSHSARFWAIVESVLPDYKARLGKLKELQKRLANEDWD